MSAIDYTQFRYDQLSTPTADVITVIAAKDFARHDETGDTAYDARQTRMFRRLISAAEVRFETFTGKNLRVTDYRATIDSTPEASWLWLCHRPLFDISKIYALDSDGVTQTVMDSDLYTFDKKHAKVISDNDWPTGSALLGEFNIEYSAGLAEQIDGAVNANASIAATTIQVKNLASVPDFTGVITLTSSSARESLDYISWTVIGGIYTFILETPLTSAFSIDDTASVVSIPEGVRTILLQMVAYWYDYRQAGGIENVKMLPQSAMDLMGQYTTRRL